MELLTRNLTMNAIQDVVDKVGNTYDSVLWSGKQTRQTIVNTAIATGQFMRELGEDIFLN